MPYHADKYDKAQIYVEKKVLQKGPEVKKSFQKVQQRKKIVTEAGFEPSTSKLCVFFLV